MAAARMEYVLPEYFPTAIATTSSIAGQRSRCSPPWAELRPDWNEDRDSCADDLVGGVKDERRSSEGAEGGWAGIMIALESVS